LALGDDAVLSTGDDLRSRIALRYVQALEGQVTGLKRSGTRARISDWTRIAVLSDGTAQVRPVTTTAGRE
jgi:hypothetical protein